MRRAVTVHDDEGGVGPRSGKYHPIPYRHLYTVAKVKRSPVKLRILFEDFSCEKKVEGIQEGEVKAK